MDSDLPSETIVEHLAAALEAEATERKDYHVRQALQVAVAIEHRVTEPSDDR